MRIMRSIAVVPVLSLVVAAFAACSADTNAPGEGDQVGSAREAVVTCPDVATLQQCTVQSPCNLNLSGCDYSNAQLPGFYNQGNMSGTIFAGAYLVGAYFDGNTAVASFAGANLTNATLPKNANGANLSGANVTGTQFLGNTNGVNCANLVVDPVPGSNPPVADLPTGLPSTCLGNVTVSCPPVACEQGTANQSTAWVCTYASDPDGTACTGGACCGGGCVDTATDANNCGACGNVCAAGDTCQAGACVAPSICPCNGQPNWLTGTPVSCTGGWSTGFTVLLNMTNGPPSVASSLDLTYGTDQFCFGGTFVEWYSSPQAWPEWKSCYDDMAAYAARYGVTCPHW